MSQLSTAEVARQTIDRLTRREKAILTERNEAADILAEALGYPNDPEYGYPTGDHTIVTLAMEVRRRGVLPESSGKVATVESVDPPITELWESVKEAGS